MTTCREFRELISLSLDQALEPEEQTRLDAHLAGCEACRTALEAYQSLHRQIRGLDAVEPPPWLTSRIMARVHGEPQPTFWRRFVRPLVANPQLQVASILLLCLTGYFLLKNQPPALRPTPAAPKNLPEATSQPEKAAAQAEKANAQAPKPADTAQSEKGSSKEKAGFAAPPPALAAPVAPPTEIAPLSSPEPMLKKTEAPMQGPAPAVAPATEAGARLEAAPGGPSPQRAKARNVSGGEAASAAGTVVAADKMESKDSADYRRGDDSPVLSIRWQPSEPASASQTLEKIVAQVGGKLMDQPGRKQGKVLTARLDSRRLPELVARLGRSGTIREAPEPPRMPSGPMVVSITW